VENGFGGEPAETKPTGAGATESRTQGLGWSFLPAEDPATPTSTVADSSDGFAAPVSNEMPVTSTITSSTITSSAITTSTITSSSISTSAIPTQSRTRRRRTLIVTGCAILILVIAVGVGVGISSSRNHPANSGTHMASAAFVVASTQATMAQHTADVSISGTVGLGGTQFSVPGVTTGNVAITGTGEVDFDTNQLSLTATAEGSNIRILTSDGNTYLGGSFGGTGVSPTGGAEWIELPSAHQSSAFSGMSSMDPLTMMKSLQQKGWTVQSLGTSTIGGTAVSGYAATLNGTQAAQQIQKELQSGEFSGEIPSKDGQGIEKMAGSLGTFTVDVYVDGSKLLRELSVQLGGGKAGISESLKMDFENYGTPVNIETPPPGDVVSMQQLEKGLLGNAPTPSL
jgi:hypothetical protein